MSANAYEQSFTLSHGCANSPNPNTTGVVAKLGPDLSQMLYSTYYGGKTGGIRTAVPIATTPVTSAITVTAVGGSTTT